MPQKELNSKQRNKYKMTEKAKKEKKKEDKKETKKKKIAKPKEKNISEKKSKGKKEEKKQKKIEKKDKKKSEKKPVVKKTEAVVNGRNLPISTKHAVAICKFIKKKKISRAISDLEQVVAFKKSVPMKGEIPHRRGKGLASGRFPKKAAREILKLLKSASANAVNNGIENPVISEAVANIGSRPWGKFGQVRKKRTHIKIIVKSKKKNKNKK